MKAPGLKAGKNLRKIMVSYYSESQAQAREGAFVVWIAIGVPIDILRGFDLVISIPENFAAASSAKASAVKLAEAAEADGYSMDLCSYARISLGASLHDEDWKNMPEPDLLISCTDNCSLISKWFDVFHREFDVPHFILDIPFCYETQNENDLNYIVNQYRDLIGLIEKMTGQSFNEGKMAEARELTFMGVKHWKRFLAHAAHRPSGITAFDIFIHMAPYVVLRGTQQMVDHFRMLADEIGSRIESGVYPVPEEKYRLLWDNIAPWHQIKKMSARLRAMEANIIFASYGSCIGSIEGEIDLYINDESDILRKLARYQNSTVCPYGLELRFKAMSDMIERYAIDGVILASNISCKPYSVMQMDLKKKIQEKHAIPTVMIDLDHADVRKYSEEATFTRIEALLEEIEGKS